MAKSFADSFLFCFFLERKKNLSPDFWSDGTYFLDLVDFFLKKSTESWDFSSLSFDKRPLNVGRHVLINLKLIDMAFGCDVR